MENKLRLQSLANEYNATIAHADSILHEYIKTVIEQAFLDAFNELDDSEKLAIILDSLFNEQEFIQKPARLSRNDHNVEAEQNPVEMIIGDLVDLTNALNEKYAADMESDDEVLVKPTILKVGRTISPCERMQELSDEQKELIGFIKFLKALQEE